MKNIILNLKTASNLYNAISYADEQVMSSDIPVYVDGNLETEEDFNLNRVLSGEALAIADQLLNMFGGLTAQSEEDTMRCLSLNLKMARILCRAISYADEQVMSSDIAVYLDHGIETDDDFNLNRALNKEMLVIAGQLLNMFSNSIIVKVLPGCISSNREAQYILSARRSYLLVGLTGKIKVIREDDDSAELIYRR